MGHAGPDGLGERPVAAGGQPVGHERRQAPVLAARAQRVGRGPDRHAGGQLVLERPGVEPVGGEPDGQVVHHPELPPARPDGRQLLVEQPLEPGVVGDLLVVLFAERSHLGPAGMAVGGRPGPPVLAVDVLEGAEGGEPLQVRGGGAVGGQPVLAARGPVEGAVGQAQRLVLQPVHGRPVDPVLVQQAPAGPGQGLDPGPVPRVEGGQLGHVLDAEIERVAEHPAGGVVGAGLGREGGVQRVEQGEPRPQGRRGRQQAGQVAEVADAPAGPRADRVQLGRPAPGAPAALQLRRQVAAPGRDHQGGGAGPALDPVPARGQVAGQLGRQGPLLARLQHQGGRLALRRGSRSPAARSWRPRPAARPRGAGAGPMASSTASRVASETS